MNASLIRALATLFVLGLLVSGCSTDHPMDTEDNSNSSMMAGSSTDMADIAFAQMMIPHHEQAVVMSEYALANTENPQI
jgi:uncharacterized protein (DUF305 family)